MNRQIVEDVLGKRDVAELWGAGYNAAIPVTPQDFAMGSVLTAVLYMMRWSQRRGKGKFTETFGKDASVETVASRLAGGDGHFVGFGDSVARDILADLLLAFALENRKKTAGRLDPIQRVFPTHYFASWVDLPADIANLRRVPELITMIVSGGSTGNSADSRVNSDFTPGSGFNGNLILGLFGLGTSISGERNNLRSDCFKETTTVGLDQLITIRVAQQLNEAPAKARGEAEIPTQLPVAVKVTGYFREDLSSFLTHYGPTVPRLSLLPMLESSLAIGITNIFLTTLKILMMWEASGSVVAQDEQAPWELFVDCSASTDHDLRRHSEESVDDLLQRITRLPVVAMCLRILDQWARQSFPASLPSAAPDPTERIDVLGRLLHRQHEESQQLFSDLRKTCNKLAEAFAEAGESDLEAALGNENIHPAWRLAEAIVAAMGNRQHGKKFVQFLDSSLMTDQPNGLARKRRSATRGRASDRRSIVLTNTVLDYLVHLHISGPPGKNSHPSLTLNRFISLLRERYGLCLDAAPAGMSIPDELLRRNRNFLEQRLRDLGLFVGVNDAEAMKRLKSRFEVHRNVN